MNAYCVWAFRCVGSEMEEQGMGIGHQVTRGWWPVVVEGGTWGSQRLA